MEQPQQNGEKDSTFNYISERLEGKKDSYGMLMKEIVKSGICTHCSACTAVCDVLDWVDDQPKLVGKCTGCGICYNQCPRTITVPEDLVGKFRSVYIGRSTIPEVQGKGQDGGITTSLLVYLLDKGLIDGAVVTKRDENWGAKPAFVKTKEGIISAAGSLYVHSQTVKALFDAIKEGNHAVAFVGTPCNIDAIAKMEHSPYGIMLYNLRNQIFKIGLFCMDSFSPETLYGFFARDGIDLKTIKKMDISMGKFNLYDLSGEKVKSYTIKSLNKYKSSSCNFCVDLTSEWADVSIGSVGSPEGYNTIICRSAFGELVLKDAAEHGYIEIKEATDKDMEAVLRLAKMKKQSLYNVNVRTQYVFTPPASGEVPARTEFSSETTGPKIPFLAKKLKLKAAKLTNKRNNIKFTLANESGYIMENLDLRISVTEDIFEKSAWHAKVAGLYPYESMVFDYPINVGMAAEESSLEVMVEVRNPTEALLVEKISIQKLITKANEKKAKAKAKAKSKN
ncbi:MAG: Coenzyme F420 hydrogenase/dehydrogenase, beta subunit C-terminal domain [Promethearchaeota archaeon]